MNDSNDIYRLLSEPVIPEEDPRPPWMWLVGAAILGSVVFLLIVWAGGDPEPAAVTDTTAGSGDTSVTSTASGETTTTLPPFQHPDLRFNAAMVFDPGADRIVLVGGRGGTASSPPVLDAWTLDPPLTWSPIEATLEPPAREQAGMVYAPVIERVMVLGGSPVPTQACGLFSFVPEPLVDVWTLDSELGEWDRPTVSSGPSLRWGHAVAYVPGLEKILLFGGVGTERRGSFTEVLGDTWLFDPVANTWEQLDVPGPPARGCPGMVHDAATGLVYLWGGQVAQSRGDSVLWAFDPESLEWSEVDVDAGPDDRWVHQMVFEPTTGLIYSIGGFGRHVETSDTGSITSLQAIDDVWAFDPETATWVEKAPLPAGLAGHAAAPDGRGNIVVYTGLTTLIYDTTADTWTDVTPWDLLEE